VATQPQVRILSSPPLYGVVAQLVRVPACHAGGCGFKSRLSRQFFIQCLYLYSMSIYTYIFYGDVAQLEEHLICIQKVIGSIAIISTNFKGTSL
jgi:hypothetical protein